MLRAIQHIYSQDKNTFFKLLCEIVLSNILHHFNQFNYYVKIFESKSNSN